MEEKKNELLEIKEKDAVFVFREDGSDDILLPTPDKGGKIPFKVGAMVISKILIDTQDDEFLKLLDKKEIELGMHASKSK